MAALPTLTSASSALQVFRLEDSCCLFTLQGHSGAITAVYIDQVRCSWVCTGKNSLYIWLLSHWFSRRDPAGTLFWFAPGEVDVGFSEDTEGLLAAVTLCSPELHSVLLYCTLFYSIPFYSIPFYSIVCYSNLFYSISFYYILSYLILFSLTYPVLLHSILFYSIPFQLISFYFIQFYFTLFHSIQFYFT